MKFDRGGGSVNSHIGSGDGGGGGGSGNGSGGDSGSIGSAVTTESEVGREEKKNVQTHALPSYNPGVS